MYCPHNLGQFISVGGVFWYLQILPKSVILISNIRSEFGVDAMEVLKNSPFELCRISGFGFKTVDDIARKTQCRPDDPLRIKGALRFVLDESMLDGHLYLDKETIRAKAHVSLDLFDTSVMNDGRREFHVNTPKTQAGIRIIPMLRPVKEALLHLKRE